MLLDMEDADHSERLAHDDDLEETLQRLENIAAFVECTKMNARFARLAGANQLVIDVVNQISLRQSRFFCKILTNPMYCQYAMDVILLASHRTRLVIQDFGGPRDGITDNGGGQPPVPSWRENNFDSKTIRSLKLTDWQLQLLVSPWADMRSILTSCQWDVYFKQETRSGDVTTEEMHLRRPGTPINMSDADHGLQRLVRTLFGQLEKEDHKTLPSDSMNPQKCRGTRETSVRATFTPAPPSFSARKTLNTYERGRIPQPRGGTRSAGPGTGNDNPFTRMRSVGSGAVSDGPFTRTRFAGSGTVNDNPFTRVRFAKRAASPHELESKRIRATDQLKEDWLDDIKTELMATSNQLRKELSTQLRNEFREEVIGELRSHVDGIRDSMQAMKESRLEHALGLQADCIQKVLDAIDRPIPIMATLQNDIKKITQARTTTPAGAQASVNREISSNMPLTRSASR